MNRTPFLISIALLAACGPKEEEKEDLCEVSGNICTWAGVPQQAQFGADDVPADESYLYLPQDVTFAPDGTGYLPDFNNHRIRTVDVDGIISTVSGTGFLGDGPEGTSSTFAWNHPTDIAVDPGNPSVLHISAWHNSRLNRIDLAGGTTIFECGTGGRDYGGDGGPAMEAILDLPSSLAFDSQGNIYFSDQANQAIRRVTTSDTIELIAGSPGVPNAAAINSDPSLPPEDKVQDATAGYAGDGGPAIDALLYAQVGQAADPSNKLIIVDDVLYVADSGNNIVRVIDLATQMIDRFAGVPWRNSGDDLSPASDPTAGDGGAALDAYLNNPRDIAMGVDGELYIADTDNHCVRVVHPDGTIDTFAGSCGVEPLPGDPFVGEKEPALDALLFSPYGVATDGDGNVYIADTKNHVIRRVKH